MNSLEDYTRLSHAPWAIIDWWSKWHTTYPAVFIQPLQVGGALAAVVLVAYIFQLVTRAQALREYSDIHGSARWAKLPDIKQTGLINQVFIEAIGKSDHVLRRSLLSDPHLVVRTSCGAFIRH